MLGAALFTIYQSFFIPIYPDEIAYRFMHSRIFDNGFKSTTLFPMCTSLLSKDLPYTWYPIKMIDGLIFGRIQTFEGVRWAGIFLFCIYLVQLLYLYLHNALRDKKLRFTLVMMLLFIGVNPYLFVMTRYESVILIFLNMLLIVQSASAIKDYLKVIIMSFLIMSLYSLHSKALLLSPFLIIILWNSLKKVHNVMFRISIVSIITFSIWESYLHYSTFLFCPEVPSVLNVMKGQTLDLDKIKSNFFGFLRDVFSNLRDIPKYFKELTFKDAYPLGWLAGTSGKRVLDKKLNVFFILYSIILLKFAIPLFKKDKRKLVESASLILSFLAYAAFNKSKYFYESVFAYGLLNLLLFLIMKEQNKIDKRRIAFFMFLISLQPFIMSQYVSIKYLRRVIKKPYVTSGIQHHFYDHDKNQKNVDMLKKECGLREDGREESLVVDDATYYLNSKTPKLTAVTYMHLGFSGVTPDKRLGEIYSTYKDINAKGLIVRCISLSGPEMNEVKPVVKYGDYCCINLNKAKIPFLKERN